MSTIQLRIYDGTRQLISSEKQLFIRLIDGNQKQVLSRFLQGPSVTIVDVPFYDNFGDLYTVLVHGDGFADSGLRPIHVLEDASVGVDLMLIPKDGRFRFSPLDDIRTNHPRIHRLLANGLTDPGLETRFNDAIESAPNQIAALLTICAAAESIPLPEPFKPSPLDYDWQLRWDVLNPDRFYAWVDRNLIDALRQAAKLHTFSEEKAPQVFHTGAPGGIGPATTSWKEVRFDTANVQFTFHEENRKTITFTDGDSKQRQVECVIVEPDIDYYKDLLAHGLLEVIPNTLTGGKTDPRMAYMLRWMAQRFEGLGEFDPPLTVEP